MNIADKMEMESRLMGNIAHWMGVRIREIAWRGHTYRIVDVDGMTCRIEKI